MNLDKLLQNMSDCTNKVTVSITSIIALITAVAEMGEKAYPYLVKIIDASSELVTALADAGDDFADLYKQFVEKLNELKTKIETEIAENGYISTDFEGFVNEVNEMHKAHLEAMKEIE